MKLTVILLIVACVQVSAATYAQQVTLSVKNAPFETVIEQVHEQTGYAFLYNVSYLKNAIPVTVNLLNTPILDALKSIFKNQPLAFEIKEKIIIITPKKELEKLQTKPSNIRIVGKVTDENGQPLAGATVKVKGTTILTTTDIQGKFILNNVPEKAILIITFIGYEAQEVSASDNLTTSLVRSSSTLDAVQIIGYGTTTKRLSTGNETTVKADVIADQPVTNPLQALEGRVAGVQIIQGNGLPGSPMQIQIRGRNSIASLNTPLYVIDGVPFTSTPVERIVPANGIGLTNNTGNGSPLNSINPADIESIVVLKDADATAIYGSRGANGVVLITTKKGKAGKTNLGINVNSGAGEITSIPQTLNTQQYLQVRKDALANSALTPTISNAYDLLSYNPNAYTDWQKWYMGRVAKNTDATATLSGGDQQTIFLLSGTYHHESTIQPTDDGYDRGAVHLNVNHTSTDKKFQINANVFYTSDNNELPSGFPGIVRNVARTIPNYPTYTNTGGYNWVNGKTNLPASLLAYYKSQTDNLNGDVNVNYNFFPGFNAKANLGYNKIEINQVAPTPAEAVDPSFQLQPYSNFGSQYIRTVIFEPQLTYTKQILKGKLDLLAGGTLQQNTIQGNQINVSNYSNDLQIESLNFGTVSFITASTTQYKYLSVFGRVTYNWDDKYIINGSFRRDGSSRFGPGKQFGNFGSIGAAWLFSNETFIKKNLSWLNFGKLRGSYGTTGNDGIGDYGYLSLYSSSNNYGNTNTIIPSQIANSNFQWEVNKKLEVALDLGLIKDKLSISSAWYRNRSSNQLVPYALPSITGFSSYIANLPALVQNTGWEFEINSTNLQKGQFKWTTALNLTIPKNELLSFPGLATSSYANSLIVGQSLNVVQKYNFLGVDPQTGLAMIQDVNKDGVYTQTSSYNNQHGDYVIAGTTDPKWYGGIANNISYKGFQLDVFFQYTRQSGYNLISQSGSVFGRQNNVWTSYLDYWKQPGDVVTVPKPFAASNPSLNEWGSSTAGFSDASFLRLKNVALSYSFSQAVIEHLKIKGLKVYIQGQNIWTLTKYNGYDPEMAGNQNLMVPSLKILTAGIQCTL